MATNDRHGLIATVAVALLTLSVPFVVRSQTGSHAPASVAFGSQTVTTTSGARPVTVANTHPTLAFQVNSYSQSNAAVFPIVAGGSCPSSLPYTLAAGESCTVHFAFTPTAAGSTSSTFFVSSTSPAASFTPASVQLSGTGTPVPATHSPASTAFGNQTVTSTSAPRAVTLANAHDEAELRIDAYSQSNAAVFPIVPGGSCPQTLPYTLEAGESCTVHFAFVPALTGAASSTFFVSGTTPASSFTPTSVQLNGTGTAVPATHAPATTAFGDQTVSTTSAPRAVTLSNTHDSVALRIDAYSQSNAAVFPIVQGGSCPAALPYTLAAGQSCTVHFAFMPSATGATSSTFFVASASPSASFTPTSVQLNGTGTAVQATHAPATTAFGNQTVTTSSAPRAVTLANTHDVAALRIDAYSQSNAAAFPIRAGGSCPSALPYTLAAGQSCTVLFAFSPTQAGGASSTFFVLATTPASSFTPTSIQLNGTGTAVPGVLAPDSVAFGEVPSFATSDAQTVSIGNADTAATLTIQSYAISQPARFVVTAGGDCPPLPYSLGPGESCELAIAFRPVAVGSVSATFTVGSTAQASAFLPATITLNGIGGPDQLFSDGFETP